ncbi:DUF4365 domain-containing protein [Antrihabitans sp. YC3-6]|uniref:DUF4365 domain-containing protein n=1 Tax=Antrihabitans stalagmiti TaxID=2799499 RepID=A0A934NVU6_9NOCA|nr:DUF4365 domain-containing protein [Antrihabitans stalagmiti]MBJ8342080.1 DUF4365 domain-containing protein [Antrihabitans stalagmiti]
MPDNDDIEQAGVALCQLLVRHTLHWIFREQKTSDYGVDAHVETRENGEATGRLLALQIKTGESYFSEPTVDGWIFRPNDRHIAYWLGHSLPVFIVLVDVENQRIYWQLLSSESIKVTDRGARTVHVPASNTIDNAPDVWSQFASVIGRDAIERFDQNIRVLAPNVGRIVQRRAEIAAHCSALLAAHLAVGRSVPALTVQTPINTQPQWLLDMGVEAWTAIANYASSHNLNAEASEAYRRSAELTEENAGRMHFASGYHLLHTDPPGARVEFSLAESSGEPMLSQIGLVLLSRLETPRNVCGNIQRVG